MFKKIENKKSVLTNIIKLASFVVVAGGLLQPVHAAPDFTPGNDNLENLEANTVIATNMGTYLPVDSFNNADLQKDEKGELKQERKVFLCGYVAKTDKPAGEEAEAAITADTSSKLSVAERLALAGLESQTNDYAISVDADAKVSISADGNLYFAHKDIDELPYDLAGIVRSLYPKRFP